MTISMNEESNATLIAYRHGKERVEDHETVEEALRAAYWGEDGGYISTECVTDSNGETVFRRQTDGNIFDFCESRGYDWTDP